MPVDFTTPLPLLTFSTLNAFPDLVHAVSTRHGGTSLPPYDTLNLTWASGDRPEAVEENHLRLCGALDVSRAALVSPRQVHSAMVRRVGPNDRGRFIPACDALITSATGVALLLRFADCVPIMLFDPQQKAIGLAHAGWRGTIAGIAQATVAAMMETLGSRPGDLIAAIGPAIGPCCYEIGPEVAAEARAAFGSTTDLLGPPSRLVESWPGQAEVHPCSAYRSLAKDIGAHPLHLDLWRANKLQLQLAGVEQIEVAGICTCCHREQYFSYRAQNGKTGHHGALLCMGG